MTPRAARVLIVGAIAAGVVFRLLSLRAAGFPSDVATFMAWAQRLAEIGPGSFYAPGYFADYPPGFLYLLWGLGSALNDEPLRLAVKAISIPFDVAIALVIARLVQRHAGAGAAAFAVAVWMLQPAPIFAGPYWGQVDAVGTLPFLLALLAVGSRRYAWAGGLASLAFMTKPQYGIALLVVGAVVAFEFIRDARWRPALAAAVPALAVLAALSWPFGLGPADLVSLVRGAAETYPYTSLYAFNVWAIATDFWRPDDGLVVGGAVLLLASPRASRQTMRPADPSRRNASPS